MSHDRKQPGQRERAARPQAPLTFSPEVQALLDHIAEELAAEYLRLMKGNEEAKSDNLPEPGKGNAR